MRKNSLQIVTAAFMLTLGATALSSAEDVKKNAVVNPTVKIQEAVKTEAVKKESDKTASAKTPSAAKELKLGIDDTGKNHKIKVGDTVTIELKGNPTTGYSWSAAKDVTDAKILEETNGGTQYVRGGKPGMVGAGGSFFFYWKAAAPGETKIKLEYKRPWEKKAANRTMEATIVVEAADAKATVEKGSKKAADESKNTKSAADKEKADTAAGTISINNKVFTEKESKTTVDAAVNDTFTIKLGGNPTTGYAWEVAGKPDKKILNLEKEDYVMDKVPAGMVGAGGNFTFKFKTLGKGTAKIRLEYKRSWEKDVPPVETFEMTVNVK